MKHFVGFTLFFLILVSINFVHSDNKLKQKLESSKVIPDLIDSVPSNCIEIKYGPSAEVKLGNELKPIQVKNPPTTLSWPVESNTLYTLMMVDPDAPSRHNPSKRQVLHWLTANIPGTDLSKGQTLASYRGSNPQDGSGLHRYTFFVFKQPGQLTLLESDKQLNQNRIKFNTKQFAQRYNLGLPLAGNYYLAQFDEYARIRVDARLKEAIEHHQVVPDVIDTVPVHSMVVKWSNGEQMFHGEELTPTQVKDIPSNVTWLTEPNALYTLVFSDPDAPSRQNPIRREFLHWLVVNIPGTDLSKGDTIVEYIGSGAPKDTGLHRYVLLIFKQPGQLALTRAKTSKQSREGRPNFSVRDFAKQNKLGSPVAGNFFQAQYDDYVPTLHAQLSGQKTNK